MCEYSGQLLPSDLHMKVRSGIHQHRIVCDWSARLVDHHRERLQIRGPELPDEDKQRSTRTPTSQIGPLNDFEPLSPWLHSITQTTNMDLQCDAVNILSLNDGKSSGKYDIHRISSSTANIAINRKNVNHNLHHKQFYKSVRLLPWPLIYFNLSRSKGTRWLMFG